MTLKKAIALLETERKKLATIRDKLRDVQSEIEGQADNADYAISDLDQCINTLSEYL